MLLIYGKAFARPGNFQERAVDHLKAYLFDQIGQNYAYDYLKKRWLYYKK